MEQQNQVNILRLACPIHPEKEIRYCCLTPECNHRLICAECLKIHNTNNATHLIKDISSLFSDEYLVSFQKKFDNFDSNTMHKKAVIEFIESFFKKLQAQTQDIIEKIRQEVLNNIQSQSGDANLPIDAIKIELESLREELSKSNPAERFEKMNDYVDKHIEIDYKLTEAQLRKVTVPVIDEEDYQDFLMKFKGSVDSLIASMFKPKGHLPPPAQIAQDNSLIKKAQLQERIPGITITFDKLQVNWVGKKDISIETKQDLKNFLTLSGDTKHLALKFGKYFLFGARGSNILDADLEYLILPPILAMKELTKIRLNLTKTQITSDSLEILKKFETMTSLQKLWISFYGTSLKKNQIQEFAKYLNKKLLNTRIVIRDENLNVVEF